MWLTWLMLSEVSCISRVSTESATCAGVLLLDDKLILQNCKKIVQLIWRLYVALLYLLVDVPDYV